MPIDQKRFPMFYPLIIRIGTQRIREIAKELGIELNGQNFLPGDYAFPIMAKLDDVQSIRKYMKPEDLEAIAKSYFFSTKEAWQKKNPGKDFDEAVYASLLKEVEIVEAKLRKETLRNVAHASDWSEFATLKTWQKLSSSAKAKIGKELAQVLGKDYEAAGLTDGKALVRLAHKPSGIVFVAIPGGTYEMGLDEKNLAAIQKIARKFGAEAKTHAKGLKYIAMPKHTVTMAPFLCSEIPLTLKQVQALKLKKDFNTTPVHGIAQIDAKNAVDVVKNSGGRFLTESEWEYIAKADEDRLWLNGKMDPKEYVIEFMGKDVRDDGESFGVHGLTWGTWVDDSWHNSYKNAPTDGSAWESHELPEMVRGGAAPMLFPWQMGGEAMLLLTVHREKVEKGTYPVLLAKDLPKRA